MPADLTGVTRRNALRLIAGAAGTGLASGTALATAPDRERLRVNVGVTGASGRRAVRSEADKVHYEFTFDALTVTLPAEAARRLDRRSDVRYVERDSPVRALAQDLPWGIDRVDAEVAHANGDTGSGADIAIIDTGIDSTHGDLAANLGTGKSFVGSTATGTGTPAWQDDNGHGTHCAGIADAVDNTTGVVGVSTAATLHAVKVLTASGAGLTSDVAAGIEYVGDKGWDVGSLSLGGGDSSTLRDACQYAADQGVLLVAAAGNSGPCTDCVGYPAAYSTVVAVSATTKDDSLADFSSTGPEIELAAPGDNIYSTYLGGTYATLSGTSMACPHVSGAAGQLMNDGTTADQARKDLKSSAEDIGLGDNEQGAGLLDVASVLGYDSSDDLGGSDGSTSGDSTAPEVSIDGLSEVETPSPHAEFDVSWSASDNEELDSVSLQLRDVTDGAFDDNDSYDVSGTSASDTTRLKAHKDDERGHEYEVTVTARDAAGNTETASDTITENGS